MKIFMCSMLLGLVAMCASSQAQEFIIYTEDFAPYNFSNHEKAAGISTDVVQEVLNRSGLSDTKIWVRPWARALHMAMDTLNVGLFSAFKSPEREAKMLFIGKVSEANSFFYKLKSRENIKVKTLQDLKKYRVGVVRNWVCHELLKREGIIDSLQTVNTPESNIKKMYAGRIDLFEIYEANLMYLCKKNPDFNYADFEKLLFNPSISGDMFFAVNKNTDQKIISRLKDEFTKLHLDGTYQKIQDKWLVEPNY